ncbi:hypothetical protein [Shinella sp. JR1-6]|uniref:hypothetical protein n=1 Tax=Shinella sp. JR1-6 TaxID=2527671 RepID=UPI00102D4A48|nr:hypothetical protein [Shinella sp. JR1-6]TAA54618.1 hypothetical protein EXZ48_26700 [Shinella sp. JR1-6]
MHLPLALGLTAILGASLALPACAETIGFTSSNMAALVSTKTKDLPPPAKTFTLAVVDEAAFLAGRTMTKSEVKTAIARAMPEEACTSTSRKANAYGAFTACIAE